MKVDGSGDARIVGAALRDSLPYPWTWEARHGGLAIGREADFKNTQSSWVYVHWGRSGRWVYLIQELLEWALDNGYRDLLYPQAAARWVGFGWQPDAARLIQRLIEEYVAATAE